MQINTSGEALRAFDISSIYEAMNHFANPNNGDTRTRNRKKKNRAWCCYFVNDFYPATLRADRACCHFKIMSENSQSFQRMIRETTLYLLTYVRDSIQLIESHTSRYGNRTHGYLQELSAIKNMLRIKLELYESIVGEYSALAG
jgi:hypothetical protein